MTGAQDGALDTATSYHFAPMIPAWATDDSMRLALERRASRLALFGLLFGLLPPIGAGPDFHQTHKSSVETAGAGKTQPRSDVTNPLVGFRKELASRIEPDFRDQFAIARSHVGKATLQRPAAHTKLARGALQLRSTVSHRYGNSRPDRVSRRRTDAFHGSSGRRSAFLSLGTLTIVKVMRESPSRYYLGAPKSELRSDFDENYNTMAAAPGAGGLLLLTVKHAKM
jgi:hypothetical protein